MFSVVKDRIQDQAIEVERMSTSECFTDPFIEGLPPNCMIMLLAWVVVKPFDPGSKDLLNKPLPLRKMFSILK